MQSRLADLRMGVIGLGYVGLPVAAALGRHFPTVAFDTRQARIAALIEGHDETGEVSPESLRAATGLKLSADPDALAGVNFFVVTVPTPVDAYNRPDFSHLIAASETVGRYLKPGGIVVYESTVYPGATEEICVPVLARASGLHFNRDFFVGYSPERMNPGDKAHGLTDIVKVTAGSTPETAEIVDAVYRKIVNAGTHRASSIRVAEAAKVIENIQRDVNIALVNELAILFGRLGLDTEEVLAAAQTKWNFLPFKPGLVGGHCIGVDPYYLTHKALEVRYHPEVILAGRRINDSMGRHAALLLLDAMMKRGLTINASRVLILGLTFKENCADIRNSRVVDVIGELRARGAQVDVYDPYVRPHAAAEAYGIELVTDPQSGRYDAALLAVAHDRFKAMGAAGVRRLLRPEGILADIKWIFPRGDVDVRL